MSENKISLYCSESKLTEAQKRQIAVEAALEIIRAGALGGEGAMTPKFNSLSKFADNIQEALTK